MRLRASQINGCAFCINMHVDDALKHGVSAKHLHLLDAWREIPAATAPAKRAALNWTEVLTKVAGTGAPDEDYELLKAHFNETEIAYLTLLIGTINLWNRGADRASRHSSGRGTQGRVIGRREVRLRCGRASLPTFLREPRT